MEVIKASNYMLIRGFKNSLLITGISIAILIGASSMAAFVLERRSSRVVTLFTSITLAGLMIPPSVVTTIWLLKAIGLYKTLSGIILIEVALGFPFAAVLYRGFMVTLPRELDEAAVMEGSGNLDPLFEGYLSPAEACFGHCVYPVGSEHLQRLCESPLLSAGG